MSYVYPIPGHAGEEEDLVAIDDTLAAIHDAVIAVITNQQSPTPDSDAIDALIVSEFAAFEDSCQQPIAENTAYLWEFDNRRGATATPGFSRVNSISKLEYRDASFAWVEIDADTYAEQRPNGVWQILYPPSFSYGALYRATLNVGYAVIPSEIAEYITDAVVRRWYDSAKGKSEFGKTSVATNSPGGSSTTAIDRKSLKDERARLVARYSPVAI